MRLALILLCVLPSVVEGSPADGARLVRPRRSLDFARDDTRSIDSRRSHARDDYSEELLRIDRDLANAADAKRVYLLYLKATLTGDFHDYRAAEVAAGAWGWPLVRAHLAFKLHRLDEAKRHLREAGGDVALAADIAFQEGREDDARRAYEALPPRWDNLARLAHFRAQRGDLAGADALYERAAGELTAKQMRDYAWVELQRGLLDLERGAPAKALEHYERASAAWSGWWLVDEHRAEALHLLGRDDEAIALYREVIARAPHPELISTLAAITKSEELFAEADRRFAGQMDLYPEAAIGHYVEHLLRRGGDAKTIVALAERNYASRPNREARDLLMRARAVTER